MARCSRDECQRWRPDALVRRGRSGCQLDGEWYCSPACLQTAASEHLSETQSSRRWPATGPRIGSLLVHQQALTAASLRLALRSQLVTRLPSGEFRVADFEDYGALSRKEGSRFSVPEGVTPSVAAEVALRGGALEDSNVSMAEQLVQVAQVARTFEALQRGLSVLMNDIDGRAITELGRR